MQLLLVVVLGGHRSPLFLLLATGRLHVQIGRNVLFANSCRYKDGYFLIF